MRTWARVFCSIRLTGKQNPIKYVSQPVGDKCVWLYGAMWPGMAWYGMVWHGVPGSLSWHCASIKVFSCTNGSTLINMLQNALLRCVIPLRTSHVCACMFTCVCMCVRVSHCHLWGIAGHPEKNIFWKVQTCRLQTETVLANHRFPLVYLGLARCFTIVGKKCKVFPFLLPRKCREFACTHFPLSTLAAN